MRALFKDENKIVVREADKNEVTLVKLFLEDSKKTTNILTARELYGVDAEVTGILFENVELSEPPVPPKPPVLKNIQVGDNLTGKTLYFEFPVSLEDEDIADGGPSKFVTFNGDIMMTTFKSAFKTQIQFNLHEFTYELYNKERDTAIKVNLSELNLGETSLIVSEIDATNPAYKYVFVADDEDEIA